MNITRLISAAVMVAASIGTWAASPSEILDAVKGRVAPDSRQSVFELTFEQGELRGVVSDSASLTAARSALDSARVRYTDRAAVYPYDRHGLVTIPVASLRTRPAHAGEAATQAVLGTPVRILAEVGEWLRVQTPDGYIAYVPSSSVAAKTEAQFDAWRTDSRRLVATNLWQTQAFNGPATTNPRDMAVEIVLGAIVEADTTVSPFGTRIPLRLPDGRRVWAERTDFAPISAWAAQPFDAEKILTTAHSMMGSPYLWGGTSVKSVDCSGLAKVSYLSNGLILRRDASQQALTGLRLDGTDWHPMQSGDLLFFGNSATGRVTHVGIYDRDGWFIHSSGQVKRNSLDPSSAAYLYTPLHAVRIHGMEGTDGIVRAADHPWYFKPL